MTSLFRRKIDLDQYLVLSTVISVFLFIKLFRAGIDVFAGYLIVAVNIGLLLSTNRLIIHRNHAIAIIMLAVTSLIAAHFSSTSVSSVFAQLLGISVMSVCYFSALLTSRMTVPQWVDLYARTAFWIALYGIIENLARHILHYDPEGEPRLKSIFAEPSLFIYTTLPAVGYYLNLWVSRRRYGLETLVFLFAYLLADSALGFLGLLLIGILTIRRRITVWNVLAGIIFIAAILVGLFFASENIRLRATDTADAVSGQKLRLANGSTFAFLSNIYVTGSALADHPILGVGIGGYSAAYDRYIADALGGADLDSIMVGLNKDDANSLFLRVAAELGITGLILLISFLVVCARVRGEPYRTIRNALLPYMIIRMSRYGGYFSVELYFFIGIYLLNYLDYRRATAVTLLPAEAPLRPA